jgi:chromosome segregation ATPase
VSAQKVQNETAGVFAMDTSGKKAYFKKSIFGGFNREDVIAYLAEQAREQTKQREALAHSLSKSTAEVRRLQEKNEKLTQSLSSTNEQLSSLAARLREVTAEKNAIEERFNRLQADLATATSELSEGGSTSIASAQVDELLQRIESLSAKNAELATNLSRLTRFKESVQGLLEQSGSPESDASADA